MKSGLRPIKISIKISTQPGIGLDIYQLIAVTGKFYNNVSISAWWCAGS